MSYTISALHTNRLYGQSFDVYNAATRTSEIVEIKPKAVYRARMGLEAYGMRCVHKHSQKGDIETFLKIFKLDVGERSDRTRFLRDLGLVSKHAWVFQAVPYAWLDRKSVNDVEIIGHMTKFVGLEYGGPAEDFATLKEGAWDVCDERRRRVFAAHLASAVAALERMSLTHCDLSHGNIMIGPGPDGAEVCCLCDFDGFAADGVTPLPRRDASGAPVRPLGTTGYQYPELLDRISRDASDSDPSILVETDRFALGAIICEMMVWDTDVSAQLNRMELLSDEIIRRRRIDLLPDAIVKRFPKGFALLQTALKAGSPDAMPSPQEWLQLLGVPDVAPPPLTRPFVQIYRRTAYARPFSEALLRVRTAGDFSSLHPELAMISYQRTPGAHLTLSLAGPLPAHLKRGGRLHPLSGAGRQNLTLCAGDAIRIGDWELRFEEAASDLWAAGA